MTKSTRKLFYVAALLGSFVLAGAGCAKTGSNITTSPVTYLSLINASTLSSNATVLLNDTLATLPAGIAPGAYSTKYGTIRPGTYTVKFATAITDSLLSQIPSSDFDTLSFYTLILYTSPANGSVQSAKIADNFTTLSSTQSNYRFFDLSPSYAYVDLYLNSTAAQPGRSEGDNASNGNFNSFQPVAAGSYTITAKVAGTDSVIATVSNVTLTAQNAFTIFLSGVRGSTSNPPLINLLQASY